MGRILFVQSQTFAYPGLYYICGALKSAGHEYRVLVTADENDVLSCIQHYSPSVVGFPCMTGLHKKVLSTARQIKAEFPDCKTLVGGIHPTLFPEIITRPEVDFICRGEGEFPTVELLSALDNDETQFPIPNISWKEKGTIHHTPMRRLIYPLDLLPFPDYAIYEDSPAIASDTYPMVYMTRGCPYSCTYCHNSNQRKIYKGLGRYVRHFSVDRILNEVESALAAYQNATAVFLGSDSLGKDLKFLSELLVAFHARFRMPYTCLIRPEHITEELSALLSKTNCHMLAFGVESGSERVRKEIMNRKYTNAQIRETAALLHRHGIKFRTYNILGLPTETKDEMLETLKLNQEIKPAYPWAAIFTPYPATKLSEYAIQNGYLNNDFSFDDIPASFFNDTILKNVDRQFILNLHSFFQLCVLIPWSYYIARPLLNLPGSFLYRIIFKVVYVYVCIKSEKRSFFPFLKLALANRKLFK